MYNFKPDKNSNDLNYNDELDIDDDTQPQNQVKVRREFQGF